MSETANNTSVSFVRKDMLEESTAPSSAIGPLAWVRDNLFSNWLNSLLTLLVV